jgi:hypothetical protein
MVVQIHDAHRTLIRIDPQSPHADEPKGGYATAGQFCEIFTNVVLVIILEKAPKARRHRPISKVPKEPHRNALHT